MKKYIQNKTSWIIALTMLFAISSCVEYEVDTPSIPYSNDESTITIAELITNYSNKVINTDQVIVGTVVGSNIDGNLYKNVYIQDDSQGIKLQLEVDMVDYFPMGRQIVIKAKDFYIENNKYGITLYGGYTNGKTVDINKTYFGADRPINYKEEIVDIQPKIVDLNTISSNNGNLSNPELVGTFVKFENIQFVKQDTGKVFASEDEISGNATSRTFRTCEHSSMELRTSPYADYSNEIVPAGIGSVSGILTYYGDGTYKKYQFYITEFDLMEVSDDNTLRCVEGVGTTPPLVDDVNQEFNGTKYDDVILDGWNNIDEIGSSKWFYNQFDANTYANLSVFKAGEERKAWLISPLLNVDAATNKIISFDSREEYVVGATLKVYVSSDYDGSKAPKEFTWTEINPTIGTGGSSSYGPWTNSGDFDISSYGNVVVAFVYEGEENGVRDGGYSIDNFKFNIEGSGGGGGEDEAGTKEDPYTVATALSNQGQTAKWVTGFIVGIYETKDAEGNSLDDYAPKFAAPFYTATNLLIAADANETDIKKCLIIQLPNNDIRASTNLVDNTSLLGSEIMYKGSLEVYFGESGLKSVNGYWLNGEGIDPDDAQSGEMEVLGTSKIVSGVNEEFGSSEENKNLVLDGWLNAKVKGDRFWIGKIFNTDYYTQMSGYNSLASELEGRLITPGVEITGSGKLSFKTAKSYHKHDGLSVYISSDFDGTNDKILTSSWTEITSEVTIASGADDDNAWISSGDYDLSSYSGETIYVMFKYEGNNTTETTTLRVDDVVVTAN